MTDKELKNKLQTAIIIIIMASILILFLIIYILGYKKADLSIITSDSISSELLILGIDENEFYKYLEIFSDLSDYEEENQEILLKISTDFNDKMIAKSQEQTNENIYDFEILSKTLLEINGEKLETNISSKDFTYNQENNTYIKNNEKDLNVSLSINIKSIIKNNEEIEVQYSIKNEANEKNIKIVFTENENYLYSKYFVKYIENI